MLIPGDGVGAEVVPAAAHVACRPGWSLTLCFAPGREHAGWGCFQRCGAALPESTLAAARQAGAILFGATQSPSTEVAGYASPILALRRELDLYGNLRPARNLPGERPGFDLLIVPENSEGLYGGREHAIPRWIYGRARDHPDGDGTHRPVGLPSRLFFMPHATGHRPG